MKSSDATSSAGKGKVPKRSTSIQYILALIAFFTTVAPCMGLGFSAIIIPTLVAENYTYQLTIEQASWVASISSTATPFGGIAAGCISDRFGRRGALHVVNCVCLIGWIVIAAAYWAKEYQLPILLTGRFVTGISTGLCSVTPIYVAEISTNELRVIFTTSSSIFVSIGILIVYMLGWLLLEDWGTAAMIILAFPITSMILNIVFLPESPLWLVSKEKPEKAKASMKRIYGKSGADEVDPDFNEIMENHRKKLQTSLQDEKRTVFTPLKRGFHALVQPSCYKPFSIFVSFFLFQQFSGTLVVMFYAANFASAAGVEIDLYFAVVLIGIMRFTSAVLLCVISRKVGRRRIAIISGAGTSSTMLLLAMYVFLPEEGYISKTTAERLSWIPITVLLLYILMSIGIHTLPFAMVAEVYPIKVRGFAVGLTVSIGYIINFLAVKTYPIMALEFHNYGVFAFYGCVALAGTIFLAICLPETKGKSFQEIEDYFTKKKEPKAET